MSSLAYFFAVLEAAARVLLGCGVPSTSITSHITRMLRPPRIGSGHANTGLSTQSDLSPVACSVDDPSKPQIGGSVTSSARIFVLLRSRGVGSTPSSQMYSAWYATKGFPPGVGRRCRGDG